MKPETLLMIQKVSRKILPKEQTWEKLVISGRKANIQNKPAKQKKKNPKQTHTINVKSPVLRSQIYFPEGSVDKWI